MDALIFDCDGVLVDTERDGHRIAFNAAFSALGIDIEWSVDRYGELLTTGGGKERMIRHFNETSWPKGFEDHDALIAFLHKKKTEFFTDLIESGAILSRRRSLIRQSIYWRRKHWLSHRRVSWSLRTVISDCMRRKRQV